MRIFGILNPLDSTQLRANLSSPTGGMYSASTQVMQGMLVL
jgi:hypothetical protein